MKSFLVAAILLIVWQNGVDKSGKQVRWPTGIKPDQGVAFDVDGHGRVDVWLFENRILVHSHGDETGPRTVDVKFTAPNAVNIGFTK